MLYFVQTPPLMKAFLFLTFIVAFSFKSSAQPKGTYFMWPYGTDDKIEFTENIYFPYASTDSLYSIAKSFVSRHFATSLDSVVTNDNKRTIECNGVFYLPIDELGERGKGYVGFRLIIACRNRAYKYVIKNLVHFPKNPDGVAGGALENDLPSKTGSPFPMRFWNQEKAKAYYYIENTIEALKESMKKHLAPNP